MISTGLSLSLPLGALLALILIVVRASGPARRTGVVGAVVLLVGGVLNAALSLAGPLLVSRFGLPLSTYGLVQLPITVLNAVGMIVIAVAIGQRLAPASAEPPRPR